ncbi:reprolysin family propeptide domain-containing protein [Phthorimaea operculella]|nr:reprolysin family propeptide domain-containing protein [Phthorimaea operculella]
MGMRCSIFKLLLFQLVVAWCSAKHITLEPVRVVGDVEKEVQDSIRNLVHTGLYSHRHLDPSQVQVVHPVKVHHDGTHLSHTLEHDHSLGHSRSRRDLHMKDHLLPHQLHYNLTVDGKPIRLDLRPSVTFISPATIVERHTEKERTRSSVHAGATNCHYTGSVRGQATSSVALSACDGLSGLLRTEHGEYWIEPSQNKPSDSNAPRPHVIFKRSAVNKVPADHRSKRSVDGHSTQNSHHRGPLETKSWEDIRINRARKLARDKIRREFLEQRRRKLAAMRRNPTAYRAHQAKLRLDSRRLNNTSSAYTSSADRSSASQSQSQSQEFQHAMRNRNRQRKRMRGEYMPTSVTIRGRTRRSPRNCATKQPRYLWKTRNQMREEALRRSRYNKNYYHSRQPFNRPGGSRRARSVSKPRHVEVLLVGDHSMTAFHNQSNIETYLLTIMNIVSSLYMDPSIGNYIKVVVVKIILLEEVNAAANLEVSTHADTYLGSFCRWQQQLNPEDDENPHHHDVAILVTRQNICSSNDLSCSTLGVAHVAGMCKPDRSCSVNEDNGIMLAHTITHELGHNFGLYHDTEKIGCHRRAGATLHIMTPIFESDSIQVAWSKCSKRDVTNFLDAGLGECLSDKPSQEEYTYPEVPAGVIFDATSQCQLQFGNDAVVCEQEVCNVLWCAVNGTCKTIMRPAEPGTPCGPDMWCQNQTCVPRRPSPTPVNGGWGEWSEWSECSRTCGAGVSTQTRDCNNPAPENNGAYCIGDRSRYKVCNTDPCPINEPTFREVQCSKFNNRKLTQADNYTYVEWIPTFEQDKPCELHCVPKTGKVELELVDHGFVVDGTPCRQSIGARDMCIAGVCYKVGCDWVVNSDMEEDACGVCGGNGSACKTVQGIYSKDTTKKTEFSLVAVIPAGSRNVKIEEKASPGNFIAIQSARTKKVYLNGAQNAMVTEYFVAGAQATYERDRDWEKVRIHGPIADDITIYQRIKSGKLRNPGVTYQYTVDSKELKRRRLSYKLTPWSPCNVTCGNGYATRKYECYDEHDRQVEISQCYHMEPPRQEALLQQCRMPPCPKPHPPPQHVMTTPTHWWVGLWQQCSKPCHMPGKDATKRRNVYCVNKKLNKVVSDRECDHIPKPIDNIKCTDVPAC